MRASCLAGFLLLASLQVIQGCATNAPRRLDSASLVGLWKGEVDTSRIGGTAIRGVTPRVLLIAAMKEEDTAAAGHYGSTQPTARVYITVVRTEHRMGIRFLTDTGERAELTLIDGRLVGHLYSGSAARPMKLSKVRSTSTSN